MVPTGTVTFVDRCGGLVAALGGRPRGHGGRFPRHYDLLDEAIAGHGGVRPVEQGEGDSVVGAFSRASDAIAAAIEPSGPCGRGVAGGADMRVRMAVHTGEAQLRDPGNYSDRRVRCARLRAIGHGGQVLVSERAPPYRGDACQEGS